ncbi:DUF1983 domain-containing protein [Xenorhabdus bovienii]|uniref:phage tail tip fiber protein n=1 Tax=Xenorhabdus bovienii TaxID=40576 RepID=UPI0039BE9913
MGFKATPIIFGIQLDWGFAPQTDDTLKTEIQYSKTHDGEGLMLLADIPYPQRTHTMQGLAAGVAFYFRARLVDKSGNQSPWTEFVRGESSSDTNWIIDAAGKEFLSNKAGQRLQEQMDFNSEAIMENAALTGAVVQRQLKVNGELKAEILHVQTTQVTDRQAFAEDMKKVQAEVGENAAAVQTKATAVFDIDGNGYAINYVGAGVKYNNQFYKAGMVIGAEVKNGQVTTSIGFNANNFGWFNPASGKMEPFMMAKNGQLFVREAFFDKTTIQKLLIGAEIISRVNRVFIGICKRDRWKISAQTVREK